MSSATEIANRMAAKREQIKRKQAAMRALQTEVETLKDEYSMLSRELWESQNGYKLRSHKDWNEADASNLIRSLSAL